jgi:methionyl-tRNA formyltransferase
MKIVYMGTPAFACPPLKALQESRHDIALVVTGVNKRSGRGKKEKATEIAKLAEQLYLPVIKPSSLKDDELYDTIKQLQPDLIVVVAFRILPKKLFSLPKFGSINIHGSLLPKYRGAAPINWALINGEKETGLSAFYLKQKVDTGDIISQVRISINDKDNFDSLYNRLSETAAPFLLETIEQIESGATNPIIQDESLVSNAPKITPFDALIDFGFPSVNVWNFVRGMSSRPGAYTFFRNKKLKILSCEPVIDYQETGTRPGTIVNIKKKLIVQCADSAVEMKQLIPDGKNEMDGISFINGFRPEEGEVMGELPKESDFSQ